MLAVESKFLSLILILSLVYMFLIFRNRMDIFAPINLVFYFFLLQYIIPAIYVLYLGNPVFVAIYGLDKDIVYSYMNFALLLVVIYFLSFTIGFKIGETMILKNSKTYLDIISWELNYKRAKLVTKLMLLFLIILFILLQVRYNAFNYIMENYKLPVGSGFIHLLIMYISMPSLIYMLWAFYGKKLALILVIFISLYFIFINARALAIFVVFYFVLFIYYSNILKNLRKNSKKLIAILIIIVLFMLNLSLYVGQKGVINTINLNFIVSKILFSVGKIEPLCIYLWYSINKQFFTLGKDIFLTFLGPLGKYMGYIDYRNFITSELLGFTVLYGMGTSGVADAWLIAGPGGVTLIPLIYGIVLSICYRIMLLTQTIFNKILYINILVFILSSILEMLTLAKIYSIFVPFFTVTFLVGLRKTYR